MVAGRPRGESPSIERIATDRAGLRVWLAGHSLPLELPWLWVRDHSEDSTSTDPATNQRIVDTFSIAADIVPTTTELHRGRVLVRWPGGAEPSVLSPELLASLVAPAPARRPWADPGSASTTPIHYRDIIESPDARSTLLHHIAGFGFGLVTGTPTGEEAVRALVDRIAYIRRTIFGDVWSLSSDETDHADSAYSTTFLEPHTDGTYSNDGPGLQLFACQDRTGIGGDSILVDGFSAAEQLRAEDPSAFEVLTSVSVTGHYIEDGVELRASRPTIGLGGDGSVRQVTFNNYDRAPFLLPAEQMADWYRAYAAIHRLIVDRDRWWTHRLEPGETLVFDNWRCLHGRLAYRGTRAFLGCYVNHEDFESALRVNP